MLDTTFWENVPPMEFGEYIENVTLGSAVGETPAARDTEAQVLAEVILSGIYGISLEEAIERRAAMSRVKLRRDLLGEWTNDDGSFTVDEITKLRKTAGVK